MFVIFDIEVPVYPWAVSYGGLGCWRFMRGWIVFLLILFIGLGYTWAKGVMTVLI